MLISYSKEIDEKKAKFIKMSPEQFDKYMCETYPIMFRERNLPMNQTCMCWGFSIGSGWFWILADLCEKLDFISRETGINVVFGQIKEKFGGARFYYSTDYSKCSKNSEAFSKFWQDMISTIINHYEEMCDYYCAECGENKHDMITIGGWVYDCCEKCLEKDKNRSEGLKYWREYKELKEKLIDMSYRGNKEEREQLNKLVKSFEKRTEKERAKQQREWDKVKKEGDKKLAKEEKENKEKGEKGEGRI